MTEHKKIFGTDGVRGVANVEPVTAETALKLGRAAAYVFAQMNPRRTNHRLLMKRSKNFAALTGGRFTALCGAMAINPKKLKT